MNQLCFGRYAKMSDDIDLAPSFSFQLLQAQVDCLPLLVSCGSAGSLKWFFVLLNRVKCMDPSLVARATTDLLNAVSSQYHRNMSPHHSLLKTRCVDEEDVLEVLDLNIGLLSVMKSHWKFGGETLECNK